MAGCRGSARRRSAPRRRCEYNGTQPGKGCMPPVKWSRPAALWAAHAVHRLMPRCSGRSVPAPTGAPSRARSLPGPHRRHTGAGSQSARWRRPGGAVQEQQGVRRLVGHLNQPAALAVGHPGEARQERESVAGVTRYVATSPRLYAPRPQRAARRPGAIATGPAARSELLRGVSS